MRKKLGIGLIIISTAMWMFSFVMNFPNAISVHEENGRVEKNGLVITSIVYFLILVLGIYLVRKKPAIG